MKLKKDLEEVRRKSEEDWERRKKIWGYVPPRVCRFFSARPLLRRWIPNTSLSTTLLRLSYFSISYFVNLDFTGFIMHAHLKYTTSRGHNI